MSTGMSDAGGVRRNLERGCSLGSDVAGGNRGRCAVRRLDDEHWVPEHVREWLRSLGFVSLPLEDMEPHIRAWDRWMRALEDFYDYRDTDGVGRVYEVHRRSIRPAMRVCREWGSLLLNDRTRWRTRTGPWCRWRGPAFSPRLRSAWRGRSAWGRVREPCGWTQDPVRCACGATTREWWHPSHGTRMA